MEQKKTLWIVLVTGIFLLVVIGAALLLFKNESPSRVPGNAYVSPTISDVMVKPSGTSDAANPLENNSLAENAGESPVVNASENADSALLNGGEELTLLGDGNAGGQDGQNPLEKDAVVNAENATVNADTVYVNGGTTLQLNTVPAGTVTAKNEVAEKAMSKTNEAREVLASEGAAKESSVTKSSGPVSPASKSDTSVKAASSTGVVSEKKTASAKESTAKKSAAASSSTIKSTTSTSSVKESSTAPMASFWIQAASYTTKKRADEARAVLEASSLPCEVFTYKDSDSGNLYYRVRVGPYLTKTEAEYWQTKIQALDYFKGTASYVTNAAAKAKK